MALKYRILVGISQQNKHCEVQVLAVMGFFEGKKKDFVEKAYLSSTARTEDRERQRSVGPVAAGSHPI